jgi:predicted ATPase/DNA-binding SARP family transcriptional activator
VGLDIALLGGLVVTRDGEPVDVRAPKQRALLALLALEHGSSVPAERLIDALWGATPPRTVGKNLQVLVGRLRASLEEHRDALESTADGYRIDADRCSIDICGFERLVARGRAAVERSDWRAGSDDLRTALALWRGESLGSYELEEWALPHVARLQDLRLAALEGALHADLELGRHDDVLAELEQVVVTHPVRERFRALHMLALYRAGRQADALDSFHAARAALDELGLEPGPDLRTLQRRILEQDPELDAPSRDEERASATARPDSLIGREEVLRELDLLVGDPGIVTVVGPAGVGKTSVAERIVRDASTRFDEVVVVLLAPVFDVERVPDVLAESCGVRASSDPLGGAAQAIGSRRVLMLVDNVEHLLAAAPAFVELRNACPKLTLLLTSRAPLDVTGERVMNVPTLSLGAAEASAPAIQLFLRRSQLAGVDLPVDPRTLETIDAICRKLDGLPLAIELAALRTPLLSCAQILDRISTRLSLLAQNVELNAGHHRSLDAAIEWSFDLLDDVASGVFVSLSVFPGGCDVPSIVALRADLDEVEVLDAVDRLLRHGLVQRQLGEFGTRLSMLETISMFARARLASQVDASQLQERQLRIMRALAETSNSPSAPKEARRRVRIELANIREAFRWAIAGDPVQAAELLIALTCFIEREGWFGEASEYVRHVAESGARLERSVEARLRFISGRVAHFLGDAESAGRDLEAARWGFAEVRDERGLSITTSCLGELELIAERFDDAQACFRSALVTAERIDDPWLRAFALAGIGNVAFDQGDADEAERLYRQARVLFEAAGDDYWVVAIGMNLGGVDYLRGELEAAIVKFAEAADLHESLGNQGTSAQARSNVMRTLMELERWSAAADAGEDAVLRGRAAGDGLLLAHALSLVAICRLKSAAPDAAFAAAMEGVELAVTSGRVRYVGYAAYVLASLEQARGNSELAAGWARIATRMESDGSAIDSAVRDESRALLGAHGDPMESNVDERAECAAMLSRYGRSPSTSARPRE